MTLLAKAVTAPAEINCTRFTEKLVFSCNLWMVLCIVILRLASRNTSCSPVAQLVEQVAVNHRVIGSSPIGGVIEWMGPSEFFLAICGWYCV